MRNKVLGARIARSPSGPVAIELSSSLVHCVMHYLSYCSLKLFMGTVYMRFSNPVFSPVGPKKKGTLEIWGITAWYQSIGERLPRELNVWCKHHSLVLELRLHKYLRLDGHGFRSCIHCAF